MQSHPNDWAADALPACCGDLWRIWIGHTCLASRSILKKEDLLPLELHGCGTEKCYSLIKWNAALSNCCRSLLRRCAEGVWRGTFWTLKSLKNKGRMNLDSLPCSSFFLSVLYCFAGYFSLIEGNRNDCGNRPANRPGTPYPGWRKRCLWQQECQAYAED